ncbi:MAG: hypothetical protein ACP5OU_09495 [Methanothrix sp.]
MIIILQRLSPCSPTLSMCSYGRKRIIMLKTAGGWIFKHFFEDKNIFKELADRYNKDL